MRPKPFSDPEAKVKAKNSRCLVLGVRGCFDAHFAGVLQLGRAFSHSSCALNAFSDPEAKVKAKNSRCLVLGVRGGFDAHFAGFLLLIRAFSHSSCALNPFWIPNQF